MMFSHTNLYYNVRKNIQIYNSLHIYQLNYKEELSLLLYFLVYPIVIKMSSGISILVNDLYPLISLFVLILKLSKIWQLSMTVQLEEPVGAPFSWPLYLSFRYTSIIIFFLAFFSFFITMWCFRLIAYFFYPSPEINHFSNKRSPWFLLLRNGVQISSFGY